MDTAHGDRGRGQGAHIETQPNAYSRQSAWLPATKIEVTAPATHRVQVLQHAIELVERLRQAIQILLLRGLRAPSSSPHAPVDPATRPIAAARRGVDHLHANPRERLREAIKGEVVQRPEALLGGGDGLEVRVHDCAVRDGADKAAIAHQLEEALRIA